jgi:hypothetical protein
LKRAPIYTEEEVNPLQEVRGIARADGILAYNQRIGNNSTTEADVPQKAYPDA